MVRSSSARPPLPTEGSGQSTVFRGTSGNAAGLEECGAAFDYERRWVAIGIVVVRRRRVEPSVFASICK
jgi:hypothetical protein